MNFRVCTSCHNPHVENCPECFGWGFHKNTKKIITAYEVDDIVDKSTKDIITYNLEDRLLNDLGIEVPPNKKLESLIESKYYDVCPICKGTPFNIDIFILYGDPESKPPKGFFSVI